MQPPQLSGIVATDRNFLLGFNSAQKCCLPWEVGAIAGDMEFFRKTTAGRVLLMGRKTALGIGRLLPGRLSLILSHQPFLDLGSVRLTQPISPLPACKTAGFVLPGWDELLEFLPKTSQPIYLLGGAEMFQEAAQRSLLKELFFTFVDASIETSLDFCQQEEKEPVYLPDNLQTWIQRKLQTEQPIMNIAKDQNNLYSARIYHFDEIPESL